MKVFILTAGIGSRLKPLTDTQPKVMIKIGPKPILEHLINLCAHHHLTDIILSTHYLPDQIQNYFKTGENQGVNIQYSFEAEMVGGGGALKLAENLFQKEPFIVLNGDVLTNVNLTEMIEFHKEKKALGTFLVHDTDHPLDSDLVEFDSNKKISKFFRPQPNDQFKPISKTGTHIFESKVLDFIPSNQLFSLEKQLIPLLLEKSQPLYAYYSSCYSKDMGTLKRLEQVRKDYQDGKTSF